MPTTDADALKILLDKAAEEIRKGLASGHGTPYWRAAKDALALVEANRSDLEKYGVLEFKSLLKALSCCPAAEQALIKNMSAQQLIADMRNGAASLSMDTAEREALRERVVTILLQLGSVGARLLVALL